MSKETESLRKAMEAKLKDIKVEKSHTDYQLILLALGHLMNASAIGEELYRRQKFPLVVKEDLLFATLHMELMKTQEERRPKMGQREERAAMERAKAKLGLVETIEKKSGPGSPL